MTIRGGEQNMMKNIDVLMVMVAYTVLLKTDIKLIIIVSVLVITSKPKKMPKLIKSIYWLNRS